MKKLLLFILLFIVSFCTAQIKFEKGYLITYDNRKRDVLIKNFDWSYTPKEIIYKNDENSSESHTNSENIKEFGIYDHTIYISYKGPIDLSSDDLATLSARYDPDLNQETVFIRQIVSGDKNLYSYNIGNTVKFFYSDSDSDVRPLIYKRYYIADEQNKIGINNTYINQLKSIFSDDTQSLSNVSYTASSLTKVFNRHNQKVGSLNTELHSDKMSLKFNLNIRPGINFYSTIKTDIFGIHEFPSKNNFRFGVEAELILPFNKNKWAILFEPTYSIHSSKKVNITTDDGLYNVNMNKYSFITIPIGVRHYMYINSKSKFFIDANINVLAINAGDNKGIEISYDNNTFDNIEFESSKAFDSFSFGIGYNYNNRFSIEAKYNERISLLKSNQSYTAVMSYTSLILGFNIF
ncbi:outer membrane beta-barrel protein [uncultured Chryseobacterium sp.]|uniref:outer membrane beta-barrel protein n=1 Tax=uncultured Chryseobacterium sp. TaxID=259322 RepID=UPI0025CD2C0A|nr:outer membrane beta-barrel protein [uncultured Chryseobacterium sp.]